LESLPVEQEESPVWDAEQDSDDLLVAADSALRGHDDVLMQLGEVSPVVGLTRRIKHLQADIKNIRAKKKGLHKTITSSHHAATMNTGAKRDKLMKEHITAGANSKNLDADLHTKNHELASLTIKQHAAAAAHASKNAAPPPVPAPAPLDPVPADDTASSPDASSLFDGWLAKWSTMRQSLQTMVTELTAHTNKLKGEVSKQHSAVSTHMETVRKAYDKEYKGRVAAVAKAKEAATKEAKAKSAEKATKAAMKEKVSKAIESKTKAVEKKTKQVEAEERLKKQFERKVKALMGRKMPDCGPIKEKEMKAKAEIRRLQAENKKIKADCERKSKEMKQKLATAQRTIAKLKSELATAKQTIASLKAKVTKLEADLVAQKKETAKQIELKKTEERAKKMHAEKQKKAEAKVAVLTKKLAEITANYNKVKGVMQTINSQSAGPHRAA